MNMNIKKILGLSLVISFWFFTVITTSYIISNIQNLAGGGLVAVMLIGGVTMTIWALYYLLGGNFDPSSPW